jgi:hypothetical protein
MEPDLFPHSVLRRLLGLEHFTVATSGRPDQRGELRSNDPTSADHSATDLTFA